jgi:hypothetical protein
MQLFRFCSRRNPSVTSARYSPTAVIRHGVAKTYTRDRHDWANFPPHGVWRAFVRHAGWDRRWCLYARWWSRGRGKLTGAVAAQTWPKALSSRLRQILSPGTRPAVLVTCSVRCTQRSIYTITPQALEAVAVQFEIAVETVETVEHSGPFRGPSSQRRRGSGSALLTSDLISDWVGTDDVHMHISGRSERPSSGAMLYPEGRVTSVTSIQRSFQGTAKTETNAPANLAAVPAASSGSHSTPISLRKFPYYNFFNTSLSSTVYTHTLPSVLVQNYP